MSISLLVRVDRSWHKLVVALQLKFIRMRPRLPERRSETEGVETRDGDVETRGGEVIRTEITNFLSKIGRYPKI